MRVTQVYADIFRFLPERTRTVKTTHLEAVDNDGKLTCLLVVGHGGRCYDAVAMPIGGRIIIEAV